MARREGHIGQDVGFGVVHQFGQFAGLGTKLIGHWALAAWAVSWAKARGIAFEK